MDHFPCSECWYPQLLYSVSVTGEGEGLGYLHPSLSKLSNQVETAASRQVYLSFSAISSSELNEKVDTTVDDLSIL